MSNFPKSPQNWRELAFSSQNREMVKSQYLWQIQAYYLLGWHFLLALFHTHESMYNIQVALYNNYYWLQYHYDCAYIVFVNTSFRQAHITAAAALFLFKNNKTVYTQWKFAQKDKSEWKSERIGLCQKIMVAFFFVVQTNFSALWTCSR